MPRLTSWIVAMFLVVIASAARADDAFYKVPLPRLHVTVGSIPKWQEGPTADAPAAASAEPYVVVDAPAEAYVRYDTGLYLPSGLTDGEQIDVVARAPGSADVNGKLFVPAADWSGMTAVSFTLRASDAAPEARAQFFKAKRDHYERLLQSGAPGAAWFRFQAGLASAALDGDAAQSANFAMNRPSELDDTIGLFTAGEALSENLQLDRVLPPNTKPDAANVPLESIKGISSKEMDWAPLIKNIRPETDPLAAVVPSDQYAVFFPTFQAAVAVMDEADRDGTPVLNSLEPRSQDAMTKERYQRQLCLSLTGVGRLLGPEVIRSVAVTGADPYLRAGSDVALLLEPVDAEQLVGLLTAQINLAAAGVKDARRAAGKIDAPWAPGGEVRYSGVESPDRRVRSYLAKVGGAVVVTNSLVQLRRLADVAYTSGGSLASAPEYTFFRDRYKRGEEGESAFLVLSDATIRRWCGPRWRIADSRRTRAAAVLADQQARFADDIASGAAPPRDLLPDRPVPDLGELRLTPSGVTSSTYGSLEFLTPIDELKLDSATESEKGMYERWRDTYQQNFRNYFDPIAIRLTVSESKLAADVTVMPLIAGSEYKEFAEVARGARIEAGAGDPHGGSIFHVALAVNKNSHPAQSLSGWLGSVAPGLRIDPLSWLGSSVALYADDDPFWAEVAAAKNPGQYALEHFGSIPVALRAEVSSGFKLAALLTAVRAYVDQSAPDLTKWETLRYGERSYVRVASQGGGEMQPSALFYSASPDGLVITLDEDVLKRSLDRENLRTAAKGRATTRPAAPGSADESALLAADAGGASTQPSPMAGTSPPTRPSPATRPWLGSSLCLQFDRAVLNPLLGVGGREYQRTMRQRAFGNLPVLNEWKHRYPHEDPVRVHERLWHTRLLDPAGGTYAWNERWQTMESTVYGHPAEPKDGPPSPGVLNDLTGGNFGISFEDHDGLRARGELTRKAGMR